MTNLISICYFGSYDSEYSRNQILIKGLKENGVKVTILSDRSPSILKYLKLFFKYLIYKKDFDAMIVGFPGQEMMFLAKFLTRKPIIFDAFTSHYGGYILDREKYKKNSLHAKWYHWLDKKSCELADLVILDTNAHIDFFVEEFNLPREKFRRVFVGTNNDFFYPKSHESSDKFIVHFHGHYIPLQGVEVIVKAANILKENKEIVFNLIGRGQTYSDVKNLAETMGHLNVNFIPNVPYHELSSYMAKADVCMGIFGITLKTQLVIPNKVFEALAMAKPIITADTPAARELLTETDACLIPAGEPKVLAEAILKLRDDKNYLKNLADNGYSIFLKEATPAILGAQLVEIIKNLK